MVLFPPRRVSSHLCLISPQLTVTGNPRNIPEVSLLSCALPHKLATWASLDSPFSLLSSKTARLHLGSSCLQPGDPAGNTPGRRKSSPGLFSVVPGLLSYVAWWPVFRHIVSYILPSFWSLNMERYTAKKTINKMKREPTEWEKIFANHISGKELISNMYKELIELNRKKTDFKWTDDLK